LSRGVELFRLDRPLLALADLFDAILTGRQRLRADAIDHACQVLEADSELAGSVVRDPSGNPVLLRTS